VAEARHVAPARRALLVERDAVAVGPEERRGQVAQQLEPGLVAAADDAGHDVALGRRLVLEVAADHCRELLERVEHGEIERRNEVEREDDTTVTIDDERLHGCPFTEKLLDHSTRRSEERRVGKGWRSAAELAYS